MTTRCLGVASATSASARTRRTTTRRGAVAGGRETRARVEGRRVAARGGSSPGRERASERGRRASALLGDQEDKDLWDELETDADAATLTADSEAPLWEKVHSGLPDLNLDPDPADGFDWSESEALAESLFGDASDAGAALQIQKADFTVSAIIDKIDRGKVNLRPSYQREYVWTVRTASKLLESLMLNIPIPTMFFHEIRNGALEVVDGKQRLTSVWSFVTGAFPDGTPFKLKGLDVFAEHNDKGFDELPAELRERILDFPLNVHTIGRQSQPEFVFEVFERLNMGATQLNEQELRNCIYQGTYTDLLLDLASDEHLLRVYRSKTPHLRMKDRELILRFFAMQRTTPEGMTSPVKAWLNEEMRENKDMTPQEARELKELFQETIKMVWEVFGESAFRPVKRNADAARDVETSGEKSEASEASEASSTRRSSSSASLGGIFYRDVFEQGEVNVALWDTVMHAFAGRSPEEVLPNRERILAAFVKVAGGSSFRKLLVSQPKAARARAEAWGGVMDQICGPRGNARGAKAR